MLHCRVPSQSGPDRSSQMVIKSLSRTVTECLPGNRHFIIQFCIFFAFGHLCHCVSIQPVSSQSRSCNSNGKQSVTSNTFIFLTCLATSLVAEPINWEFWKISIRIQDVHLLNLQVQVGLQPIVWLTQSTHCFPWLYQNILIKRRRGLGRALMRFWWKQIRRHSLVSVSRAV